jgi:hypothetical protein
MSACPENVDYEKLYAFFVERICEPKYPVEYRTHCDIDVAMFLVGVFIGAVEDKDDCTTWKDYVYSEDSSAAYDILEIMEKLELIKISMDGDVKLA